MIKQLLNNQVRNVFKIEQGLMRKLLPMELEYYKHVITPMQAYGQDQIVFIR